MKLTELDPHWLTPDMFIFRNPTGGNAWLTCKRVAMTTRDQQRTMWDDLITLSAQTEWAGKSVVLTKPDLAWAFDGNDFETLTVTPSIDASASGNWHGFITNGEVK